jgi:hypothetical protein
MIAPPPARFIAGGSLRHKELMAQIDRHALVPIGGRHIGHAVTIVIGGIVDDDVDAAQLRLDLRHHRLNGFDVTQIAAVEMGLEGGIRAKALCHRRASFLSDIAESDMRALRHEGFDETLTDAAGAAADEDALALQAGIKSPVTHASAFTLSRPRWARLA